MKKTLTKILNLFKRKKGYWILTKKGWYLSPHYIQTNERRERC